MSCRRLAVGGGLIALLTAVTARAGERLVFVGDVLLSRQVADEIAARPGADPWAQMRALFGTANFVMGNLEGAVGAPAACPARALRPCFAVAAARLGVLGAAGFRAMSVENNHAGDLGEVGREATRRALRAVGVHPLAFADAPAFARVGSLVIALVAINHVAGRDGATPMLDPAIRRALRLGSALADYVVVSVHWGSEGTPLAQPEQRREAEWLVEAGADLIVGHHPHVVQPAECIGGRPVFLSLGNHLFDQKNPATRRGLAAVCSVDADGLRCGGVATEAAPRSTFPVVAGSDLDADAALARCVAPRRTPVSIEGITLRPVLADGAFSDGDLALEGSIGGSVVFRTQRRRVYSLEASRLEAGGPRLLLLLERHRSDMDGEEAPRPYVYSVTRGGLVARWRGSTLAWPLLDATTLPGPEDAPRLLCALHRGDSFLVREPYTQVRRTLVYRWNGFGFSAAAFPEAARRCALMFQTASQETIESASRDR